jgi:hypothetical protein
MGPSQGPRAGLGAHSRNVAAADEFVEAVSEQAHRSQLTLRVKESNRQTFNTLPHQAIVERRQQ